MTQLINDLDDLRSGKKAALSIKDSIIQHARANRFYLTTKGGMKILNEWNLILELSQ